MVFNEEFSRTDQWSTMKRILVTGSYGQIGTELIGALRKKYGKDLALMGGIDKRILAKDKKSIEVELTSKLPYLLSSGGYIPFIDHNLPPNISFANFEYYMELKKELIEQYS